MAWSTVGSASPGILVAAVFIYDVSLETKQFEIIKQSIGGISSDRRLQVLLIALALGALLEGAGGGEAVQVGVTGLVDHAHAAFAELLDDLVVRQPLTDHAIRPDYQVLSWKRRSGTLVP